jgi:anaerobic ribonucleoside-triphosphate reductase activating protein
LLDPAAGWSWQVDDVVTAVRAAVRDACCAVEGVTVLGGEPFEQAGAVAGVLRPLRQDGLSTMVYSGHTLEHLRRQHDAGIHELLAVADILVDGPYLPQRYSATLAWRGSDNQRLLCLTERYTPEQLEATFHVQGKAFSLQVSEERITVSGLQIVSGIKVIEDLLGLEDQQLGVPANGRASG